MTTNRVGPNAANYFYLIRKSGGTLFFSVYDYLSWSVPDSLLDLCNKSKTLHIRRPLVIALWENIQVANRLNTFTVNHTPSPLPFDRLVVRSGGTANQLSESILKSDI